MFCLQYLQLNLDCLNAEADSLRFRAPWHFTQCYTTLFLKPRSQYQFSFCCHGLSSFPTASFAFSQCSHINYIHSSLIIKFNKNNNYVQLLQTHLVRCQVRYGICYIPTLFLSLRHQQDINILTSPRHAAFIGYRGIVRFNCQAIKFALPVQYSRRRDT